MKAEDITEIIRKRMDEQGLTTYALSERLKGRVARPTLYTLVTGKTPSVKLATLAAVFGELGIGLAPQKKGHK